MANSPIVEKIKFAVWCGQKNLLLLRDNKRRVGALAYWSVGEKRNLLKIYLSNRNITPLLHYSI
jgi:hypothetical protein